MTSPSADAGVLPSSGCPVSANRMPLYGPEFAADPHRMYEQLRHDHGAVAPVDLAPGVPATLVLSYETALEVLRDPFTYPKSSRTWDESIPLDCPVRPMMAYRPNFLFVNGETHARLRRAATESLARVDTNSLREYVEDAADELIDRFVENGAADLVEKYCQLLPLLVFSRFVGCPRELADRLVAGMKNMFDGVDARKANEDVIRCIAELIGHRREHPGADVTTWMMNHPVGLHDEELLHQLIGILAPSTEPVQNLISNAVRLLLADERFAGDLGGGSMPVHDALDEVLWVDPPMSNYGITFPEVEVDLAGKRLPAHQPVVISFTAANNDPDLRTDSRIGNRAHLAWSAGPHTCPAPAQSMAKVIASTAIEKLLDRLPDLALAVRPDELGWRPGAFSRALAALPVTFTPQPVPDRSTDTLGDSEWNRSSSTSPVTTSTPKPSDSASEGRRPWYSFLVTWWRGR